MRELAVWGIRSLGPPTEDEDLYPGWLESALDTVFAPVAPAGSFEFRIGDEVASIVGGVARGGPADAPDVVVEGEPACFYNLFVHHSYEGVRVEGDRELLTRLLDAASTPAAAPPAAPVAPVAA
jgi:hypothetical protein